MNIFTANAFNRESCILRADQFPQTILLEVSDSSSVSNDSLVISASVLRLISHLEIIFSTAGILSYLFNQLHLFNLSEFASDNCHQFILIFVYYYLFLPLFTIKLLFLFFFKHSIGFTTTQIFGVYCVVFQDISFWLRSFSRFWP